MAESSRRPLRLALLPLMLGVVGLAGAGFAAGVATLYPFLPRDLGGAPDLDSAARRVRIAVAPGDSLDGWFVPGTHGADVLLLHGYGRMHARMWRYGGFLHRAGYGLLAVDFRSSRSGRRLPTTLGHYELADAAAALDWLERERPRDRMVVYGESLGASVGLVLAGRRSEVAAVVADCPFASASLAIEETCERWLHVPRWPLAGILREAGREVSGFDPGELDVRPAAVALRNRPVFFIVSTDDDRFSPEQGRGLWREAGAKDPLWVVDGAGHNQAWQLHRVRYEREVLAFLDRALAPQTAPRALAQATVAGARR